MGRHYLTIQVIAIYLLGILLAGCSASPATTDPGVSGVSTVGFASEEKLTEHFHKHGSEFGCKDESAYLKLAQTLRDKPVGGDVIEAQRSDQTITRFDRSSGAFIAFDPDKVIRTFFKPNDGEAYFKRQLRRNH